MGEGTGVVGTAVRKKGVPLVSVSRGECEGALSFFIPSLVLSLLWLVSGRLVSGTSSPLRVLLPHSLRVVSLYTFLQFYSSIRAGVIVALTLATCRIA